MPTTVPPSRFVARQVKVDIPDELAKRLKARKHELAAGLFGSDAGSTLDLTEAEVEELFGGM